MSINALNEVMELHLSTIKLIFYSLVHILYTLSMLKYFNSNNFDYVQRNVPVGLERRTLPRTHQDAGGAHCRAGSFQP